MIGISGQKVRGDVFLNIQRSAKDGVLVFGVLAVASVVLLLGAEWIHRGGNVFAVTEWIRDYRRAFQLNVGITFVILLGFTFLFGSVGAGLGLTATVIAVGTLISSYKLKLIGDPLFPWDLKLGKQGMDLLPLVAGTGAFLKLAAVVAAGTVLFLLGRKLPGLSGKPLLRTAAVIASMLLFALAVSGLPRFIAYAENKGIQHYDWIQSDNYERNGALLSFLINTKHLAVPKPDGYSETVIRELLERIQASGYAATEAERVKPNVIIVMNEAFWDPTALPNIGYSEDPMPFFRSLSEAHTTGYLLSPQYGGGTSNVEYEVLTGHSMSFLPPGSNPYQQFITRPTPSLASYFKEQGYKSVGIHSYDGWFWNRSAVYKHLGFDSFKSKEYFVNPEMRGHFIADEEVSRAIIRQTEQSEEPVFVYAVTMQNHGPYLDQRYGEPRIRAEGPVTEDARTIIETFAHGVSDADASLRTLVEHYAESEEPTVIVFFGDHLPMLGYDYDVFRQTGYIRSNKPAEWSLEEQRSMYSVPYVLWSNYELPRDEAPVISTSFLGAYLLNRIGFDPPPQFAFATELYRSLPVVSRSLYAGPDQRLLAEAPEELMPELQLFKQLQYDALFGKQYAVQHTDSSFYERFPAVDYNREFSELSIQETRIDVNGRGGLTVSVDGDAFGAGTFIWINGQKLTPFLLETNILQVELPKAIAQRRSEFTLQVKKLNSKGIAVAQSQELQIQIP